MGMFLLLFLGLYCLHELRIANERAPGSRHDSIFPKIGTPLLRAVGRSIRKSLRLEE